MDLIQSVFDFFNNFGWPGIVCILIGGLIVLCLRYIDRNNDRRSDQLSENIINAMSTLMTAQTNAMSSLIEKQTDTNEHLQKDLHKDISDIQKSINDNMKDVQLKIIDTMQSTITHHYDTEKALHKESQEHRQSISENVSDKLWDMMKTYNAQRAIIIEMHNGGVNLDGLSFVRYDITNEKVEKGINPINGLVQNLPAVNLVQVCHDVNKAKHHVVIYDREGMEDLYNRGATVLYNDLTVKLDVAHIIYSGIYDDNNSLYGLVVLEYENGYVYPETTIDIVEIAKETHSISELYKYTHK